MSCQLAHSMCQAMVDKLGAKGGAGNKDTAETAILAT
jgi:hypothetical protein